MAGGIVFCQICLGLDDTAADPSRVGLMNEDPAKQACRYFDRVAIVKLARQRICGHTICQRLRRSSTSEPAIRFQNNIAGALRFGKYYCSHPSGVLCPFVFRPCWPLDRRAILGW